MAVVAVCGVESCGGPGYAKGYCRSHYERYAKYGNAEEPARQSTAKTLADKLSEGTPTGLSDTECWEWTKYRNDDGYGMIRYGSRLHRAHRVAYELDNDTEVPTKMVIRHRCDNPPCVNPQHLDVGTQADNIRDMISRGRRHSTAGELSGSAKLTEDAVLSIRKMYADGSTGTAIAKEFGISSSNVYDIVNRTLWSHI